MRTMKPIWRYLAAALLVATLQTGVLGYLIAGRAAILRNGAEILLKTAPVDPRDLLRGEYVILSYDISSIPAQKLVGALPAQSGRTTLRVRVARGTDGFFIVSEASFGVLPPVNGTVVLETLPFSYYPSSDGTAFDLTVEYGIERYYVPEGQGKRLEDARGTETLSVAVRVSAAGQAQIRALLLDGVQAYDEPLF